MDPKVAMDLAGDFAVTWQSYGQDGSGYGVYARRYNAAGAAQGNEFLVNTLITGNWQKTPDIGMDGNGDFIITWSSFGQNQQSDTGLPVAGYSYYGISCRMFNADGSDYQYTNPTTGTVVERRVARQCDAEYERDDARNRCCPEQRVRHRLGQRGPRLERD